MWTPPTVTVGDRVQRVMARWIDAPALAFVNPADPRVVVLGEGKRSDGTWAPVGMPYDVLRYVLHVTAPMGRGKSEWLRNMFHGLMQAGSGCMVLDCKGKDLVNGVIHLIPQSREGDVSILDLSGTTVTGEDLRASMNLLAPDFGRGLGLHFSQQASMVLKVFATFDPKFESLPGIQQFAKMGMIALLEGEPRATLMHLIRFFGDGEYRTEVCQRVATMQVKDFWERRFAALPQSQLLAERGTKRVTDDRAAGWDDAYGPE